MAVHHFRQVDTKHGRIGDMPCSSCLLYPSHPPSLSLIRNPSHESVLRQEEQTLRSLGAREEVPPQYQGRAFYFCYFLIPKARRGVGLILDLWKLNKTVKKVCFHMVSFTTTIPLLDLGDWYAAHDLRDVCFHVSIHPGYSTFLRLVEGENHSLSSLMRVFILWKRQCFTFISQKREISIECFMYFHA